MEYVFESSRYEQLVEHANKVNKEMNDKLIIIKEISHEYSGVEENVKYVKFDIVLYRRKGNQTFSEFW